MPARAAAAYCKLVRRATLGYNRRVRHAFATAMLALFAALCAQGCRCQAEKPPPAPSAAVAAPPAVALPVAPTPADLFAHATITGQEPPAELTLQQTLRAMQVEARKDNFGQLEQFVTAKALKTLKMDVAGPLLVPPSTVWDRLEPEISQVEFIGGRAAVVVRHPGLPLTSWFYLRQGRWQWDLADARELQPAWLGPADPENHPISLQEALQDVPGDGPPELELQTTAGPIRCTLFADQVPQLVAHVIGLATGKRASRRIQGRIFTAQWQHAPLYDGQLIYKNWAGKRIESGDPFGQGTGHAGFRIGDVFDLRLRHDKPGVLSLVSLGPHSCSSMFQIILQPMPELDDRAAVFGQCRDLPTVDAISRLPQNAVRILRAVVQRGKP